MAWDEADLAEGILEIFDEAAALRSVGDDSDELDLVAFGTQNVPWCSELGLNMAEALAMVGVHYSDPTTEIRISKRPCQTKTCPVCGAPTVYVTHRRRRSRCDCWRGGVRTIRRESGGLPPRRPQPH